MAEKAKKIVPTGFFSLLMLSMLRTSASAQEVFNFEDFLDGIFNPDTEGGLLGWIQAGLNLAIGLSALVAVAVLVYGGILYITSSGDEGKIETATKAITYAIIGLVICFISVLIVNFVLEYVIGTGTPS